MTTTEILAKVEAGTLKASDAATLLAQLAPVSTGGRVIKQNSKGGLFVRDPDVKAYSETKGKEYVVSINLPWSAAQALFGKDDGLRKQVCDFVQKAG